MQERTVLAGHAVLQGVGVWHEVGAVQARPRGLEQLLLTEPDLPVDVELADPPGDLRAQHLHPVLRLVLGRVELRVALVRIEAQRYLDPAPGTARHSM